MKCNDNNTRSSSSRVVLCLVLLGEYLCCISFLISPQMSTKSVEIYDLSLTLLLSLTL